MKKTIGKSLSYGFAGNVAQQHGAIIASEIVSGVAPVKFGQAVMFATGGKVSAVDATFTEDLFIGVASAEVRSAITVDDMDGVYRENDLASILKEGVISVICQDGTPAKGGKVYVRFQNPVTDKVLGGFEATASADVKELSNAVWTTDSDDSKVSAIRLRKINLV